MLKEIRQKYGLTQIQLAEKSGVNLRMLQYYEQGVKDINGARLSTLANLAIALECPISDILSDQELIDTIKKATLN